MIPLWLVALGVVAFASDRGGEKKAPFKSITTTYTPPLPGEDPETPGRAPPPRRWDPVRRCDTRYPWAKHRPS